MNNIDWIIYPILNPDGYEFSWTSDRMWRKNRNDNDGNSCKGVDLNRNYEIEWMENGSSSSKCSSKFQSLPYTVLHSL